MESLAAKINKIINDNLTTIEGQFVQSIVFNRSWQKVSKFFPDNYFDFVVDDIPYGLNVGNMAFIKNNKKFVTQKSGKKNNIPSKSYSNKNWDIHPPSQDYFDEMKRISKNQIIFGIEYVDWSGVGPGRLKWNKGVAKGMSFKEYELAYCSCINHVHEIDLLWSGMMQAESLKNPMKQQGNKILNEKRIHPTQKPILLYKKIAIDFDLKGKKIFCGHNGSGSDRIAFYGYANTFVGCEIDKEHYMDQENRFKPYLIQQKLFY